MDISVWVTMIWHAALGMGFADDGGGGADVEIYIYAF